MKQLLTPPETRSILVQKGRIRAAYGVQLSVVNLGIRIEPEDPPGLPAPRGRARSQRRDRSAARATEARVMTFPDEYGEADLVQLAEVVRDWSHDLSGSYLVEARCRPTGRIFISGYHPKELDITLLKMVHCPHCKDWHRLVLAVEPIIREPIRLIRSSGA